jgi:drug/metabolite transporter (DMT)-like permease
MSNTTQNNDTNKTHSHPNGEKTEYGAIDIMNKDDDVGLVSPNMSKHPSQVHQHHSMWGIFFIMVGSFSFSVMFLLVKLMEGKANSFTLVFYRSLVQIVLSLSSILRNREHPLGQAGSGNRCWLLVRGGFGAGAVM